MKLKNLTKYIIAAMLLAGAVYIFINALASEGTHTEKSFALNTYTSVTTYGKEAKLAAQNSVAILGDAEKRLSAYIPDSEVSRLNSEGKKGEAVKVSDELFEIIKTALLYSERTNGLFDITIKPVSDLWSVSANPRVPSDGEIEEALKCVGYKNIKLDETNKTVTFLADNMQIDLGGIAKGYCGDVLVENIKNTACEKAIIDLGGNICLYGQNASKAKKFLKKEDEVSWRVGIQTPFAPSGSYCAVISVGVGEGEAVSVVTSGAYERNFEHEGKMYHHILNPYTGYPHEGAIDSVTVIGPRSVEADALSTSAYMLPIDEAQKLILSSGYDALIIGKDKKIYTTLERDCIEIVDDKYSFKK